MFLKSPSGIYTVAEDVWMAQTLNSFEHTHREQEHEGSTWAVTGLPFMLSSTRPTFSWRPCLRGIKRQQCTFTYLLEALSERHQTSAVHLRQSLPGIEYQQRTFANLFEAQTERHQKSAIPSAFPFRLNLPRTLLFWFVVKHHRKWWITVLLNQHS